MDLPFLSFFSGEKKLFCKQRSADTKKERENSNCIYKINQYYVRVDRAGEIPARAVLKCSVKKFGSSRSEPKRTMKIFGSSRATKVSARAKNQ